MIRALPLLLAVACGGEPPPEPVTSRPDPEDLPNFAEASAIGEAATGIGPRLVTESTTPTTEGIRVPPPDMYRRLGPLNERLGQGWATHDGDRAVLVQQRSEGGYQLDLIDVDGTPQATLPFPGYPDEAWWSPRWSRSGRYLALGILSGDLLDVTVHDVHTGLATPIATMASGFAWSNATDLGVISYWPEAMAPFDQPQFHFHRPDLGRTWCPLEPGEDRGWVFTGFSASGAVFYREHRRAEQGEFEWDPVGERADSLTPRPPPAPVVPEDEPVTDLRGWD
jgi:hypothetical protein